MKVVFLTLGAHDTSPGLRRQEMHNYAKVQDRRMLSVIVKPCAEQVLHIAFHPLEVLALTYGFTVTPIMAAAAHDVWGTLVFATLVDGSVAWPGNVHRAYSTSVGKFRERDSIARASGTVLHSLAAAAFPESIVRGVSATPELDLSLAGGGAPGLEVTSNDAEGSGTDLIKPVHNNTALTVIEWSSESQIHTNAATTITEPLDEFGNSQQMQTQNELEDYPLHITMMASQVTHINPLLQTHNSVTQDNLTQSNTNESLGDNHEHYKYRTTRNTIASRNQLLVISIPRNHKSAPIAIAHSLFHDKALASEICEEVQGELQRNTTSDSQFSISGILDTDGFTKAHLMAAVEYYQVQISVYNCGPDSNEDPAGEVQVYTPVSTALAPGIHLFWDGQDHYDLGLGGIYAG